MRDEAGTMMLCNAGCVSGRCARKQRAVGALCAHLVLFHFLLSARKQRVSPQRPRANAVIQPESQVCQVYQREFPIKRQRDKVFI